MSAFDSPPFFLHQNNRGVLAYGGIVLGFCKAIFIIVSFLLCKILRSPTQNNSPGCFVSAFDSPPFFLHQNNRGVLAYAPVILVDPRGIEPLSENLLIQLSPGAFCLLLFPSSAVGRQTALLGSHFIHGRFNGESSAHGHRLNDAQSRSAVAPRGTGGIYATALPLGSHCYFIIVSV